MDILGFYWHLTPRTIGGFIINGVGDRIEVTEDDEVMQINQYLYSGTLMHYLGHTFGSGLFIRADVGFANIRMSGGRSSVDIGSGFGVLGGGGWSFDLGGTRLLLNVNYAWRHMAGEPYAVLSFSLGWLF